MIMKTLDLMYDKLADKWGINNKGHGTVHCIKPMEYTKLIMVILKRMQAKNPDLKVFIAVDSYYTRKNIVDALKENDINQDHITILSETYINAKYRYVYNLAIFVGLERYSLYVNCVGTTSDFHLFIITKDVIKTDDLAEIYKHYPAVNTELSANDLNAVNLSSPVEERRVGCTLPTADRELYDKYTDFITQCMNIFGDFDNITKARIGDTKAGISGTEFRNQLALNNGWSPELDMTIGFNRQVDECYNPNILLDKATTCYEIMRNRNNLLTDSDAKLPMILSLVLGNPDKQIMIISKRGDYAAKVTKYLEEYGVAVGDYHDCIEPKLLLDENGIPITYKSGSSKGKPRYIKSKAISSLNERLFQEGRLRVLSIKNSSSDELRINVDMWIITSPLCDEVTALKYRFNKVMFNSTPHIIYKVFMQGTVEETKLMQLKPNHYTDVTTTLSQDTNFDENNCGIVCG